MAGLPPPLAHAGHYAIWAFYALPVVVVLAAIARSAILARRVERDAEEEPETY